MSANELTGLSTRRLEALTDGIYAIAMTLLVLNLMVPEIPKGEASEKLPVILAQDWQKFMNYMVSFVLLAVYWMTHHVQSAVIKRTNATHVWINIFLLMFVVLIPFSYSLVNDYGSLQISNVIFQGNLCIVGLLTFANWAYATHDHRLVDPSLSAERIKLGKMRSLIIPVLSVIAALGTFVSPGYSNMVYLIAVFIKPALTRRSRALRAAQT